MFCAAAARSASRVVPAAMARCGPRRFVSTASPAGRSSSFKSSLLRWALAAGAVYYYNTSPVFADELKEAAELTTPVSNSYSGPEPHTVDAVLEQKRNHAQAAALRDRQLSSVAEPETNSKPEAQDETTATGLPAAAAEEEEEDGAGQGGAFNPETGEINWDCPCLGGMAHGPCGEEFKAAFSCFVYSTEEPKGMDCVEKFQGMQDCFRKYPDIYGAELEGDESPQDNEEEATQMPTAQQSARQQGDEPSRDDEAQRTAKEANTDARAAEQGASREPDKPLRESKAPHADVEAGAQARAAENGSTLKVDAESKPRHKERKKRSLTSDSHADAPWRDASAANQDASDRR
ncbi:hypothetical protein XA68_15409 [Ophiocordyceps unilateralis]|uniref:Mitochondrial intermembrane space import and assembly protein 40 n=1 Tax=Ophiocordyceps unilateralis TaxID=268505 RepID=A0A2A9P8J6_OPHUN|nr:hypothetical protein XA68_15409 [Ophiocordyceps unilateralis]